MATLEKGNKAPAFEGKNQDGKTLSLLQFEGKKVILYFYPKDDTPGCTAEACNLRDNYSYWVNKGYVLLGVSPDDEKSHRKFIDKYKLPFDLISDPNATIMKAYGAWGTKSMYGKSYEGVLRSTFVIDENGVIESAIVKVDTKEHTNQLMKELNLS